MTQMDNGLDKLARGDRVTLGADEVKSVRGVVLAMFAISALAGVFFAGLGLHLVGQGDSSISFAGFEVQTQSFGVAAIALGALTIITSVRKMSHILVEALRA